MEMPVVQRNMKVLVVLSMFLINGCQKHNAYLEGKWGYFDQNESYGELWIKDSLALLVDETSYSVQWFKCGFLGDSLILTPFLDNFSDQNFRFELGRVNESEVLLVGDNQTWHLHLIEQNVSIDTSNESRAIIYKEFGSREDGVKR